MTDKRIALYAGSFDPFTVGHLNIVQRALELFDRVVVGIGMNPEKKYTFSTDTRVNLARSCFPGTEDRLSIEPFQGLAVDHAKMVGARYIIKGVRSTQDFDYERLINDVSLTQQRGVETVLLFSDAKLSHVSSSAVKELSRHVGIINDMVTPTVRRALDVHWGRKVVGVTGTIASGKSTLCRKLGYRIPDAINLPVHVVNLDEIGHELRDGISPMAASVRAQVFDAFGTSDRKAVSDIVFNDRKKLRQLNDIYREPMLTLIRVKLAPLQGIVLLEGALLLEFGWEFLCSSGTLVIVETPPVEVHAARLQARGLAPDQILKRVNSQLTYTEKAELAAAAVERNDLTSVLSYDGANSESFSNLVASLAKV